MEQSLLKSSGGNQFYDPFESPPNFQKAQKHRKATKVGKVKEQDLANMNHQVQICPCCQNVIQKQQISINCKDQELIFLGVGYPLFYKLTRYFGLIIFLIFVISGGGVYFLVTLNCKSNCVYFFGLPIINLQMSGEDSAKITDFLHMIAAFAIFGTAMKIKSKIKQDIADLQSKFISPDQYTIMLQNLPHNINDEDIIQWCNQVFQTKPIGINFAFNVTELANTYNSRQSLTIKFNKYMIQKNNKDINIDPSLSSLYDSQSQQLKQKIQGYDNLINLYREQKVVCHKLGTVFVTFSEQKTVRDILHKYENSLLKNFLNKILSPFKTPPLLFRGQNIIVSQAPGPREVIWQNLGYSFMRSVLAEIVFVFVMVITLYFSFRFQYFIVEIAYKFRHQSQKSKQPIIIIQALAMSLLVMVVNSLLRLLIKLFTYIKQYESYSSYHASFCFYYSISYIFNTCFMIYIVHNNRDLSLITPLESQNVLVYDIHLIMLANAFSQPLYKIFDPQMWFREIKRRYIRNLALNKNPYTQSYVNQAWEGYTIQIADNYQYIFRMLVITTWFSHSAPLGVVFSLTGMFLDYWIGKYLLLNVYKRPQSISKKLAGPMIYSIELLPLIYICGVLQFTYKVSSSENIFQFLYQFLKYGVTILVIMICIIGYIMIYKPNQQTISPLKYNEVQSLFPYSYQVENPITRFKGQMKYGVLKKAAIEQQSKIIKQFLTINLKNKQQSYVDNQTIIQKIKRKNLKKLQTIQTSLDFSQAFSNRNSTSSDTSQKQSQVKRDYSPINISKKK